MRKLLFALSLLFVVTRTAQAASTFYLSSGGSGTTCSNGSPGAITAIAGGARCTGHAAGDTYYLKAGTYSVNGLTVDIADGTAANPVKIIGDPAGGLCPRSGSTNCPVEIINTGNGNSVITLNSSYVWLQGVEIDSSTAINASGRNTNSSGSSPSATEIAYGYGIYTNNSGSVGAALGIKVINCVIHDTKQGISLWGSPSTHGMEANGNLLYNQGWHAPDRGHGHGLYTQNDGVAQGIVKNNIIWGGAGQCWQFYGSDTASVKNYDVEQNFALGCTGRNYQYGGNSNPSMDSTTIKNNESTGDTGTSGCPFGCPGTNYGYYPYTCCFTNNVVQGNYTEGTVEVVGTLTGTTWSGNTWITSVNHGLDPGTAPGNADTWYRSSYGVNPPVPSVDRIKVYANGYVTGRCHVMVWNWDANTTAVIPSADISSQNCLANGDQYEILDAQNPFGTAVASGTYTGGTGITVTVPTGASAPVTPLGLSSTVTTTNGNTAVVKTGGANFPLGGTVWNGITVKIDGVSYTVSSVTDQTHLTLSSNYLGSTGTHTLTNDGDGDLAPKTTWPRAGAFIIETTLAAGTPTPTPTNTPTFTPTPTPVPATPTPTNTFTPSNTPTATATQVAATNTPTPTLTPSNTPTRTNTPSSISSTVFEVENCTLVAPMASHADAAASGGFYVSSTVDGSTTPANGGTATCSVNIPTTGDWYVWARVLTADTNSDSMYFELDGEGLTSATNIFDMSEAKQPCAIDGCTYALYLTDITSPSTTYYWNRLNRRDGSCNGFCSGGQHGTQRVLTGLTAGVHTFKFYGREVGARLDEILLTTSSGYTATDVTPTPTPVGGCKRRITCNGKSRLLSVPCSPTAGYRASPCPWR
jgi:hypothetical protein